MDVSDEKLAALLSRCAGRDAVALQQLYEILGGYLNAIAFRLLQSEDLSNDVLQEAFVQIWQNAASYDRTIASPRTWIASIVRYRALDRLARERRFQRYEEVDGGDALAEMNAADDPLQSAHDDRLQSRIHRCLQALNERARQCVMLAYLEGHSRDELAQRFDTNVNTIKSWLRRASERLKLCLQAEGVSEHER